MGTANGSPDNAQHVHRISLQQQQQQQQQQEMATFIHWH
jgi:hypothetical protein